MRNLLLLSCYTFLLPFFGFCQATISGEVVDEKKVPQTYVNVLLLQAVDSALVKGRITSETGAFVFEKQASGNYLIACSAIGYQTWYSEPFLLGQTNIRLPQILLKADEQVLAEIEVVAKKPLYVQAIDRTVINVQNSVTNAGSNALDILERSPGVSIDRVNNVINLLGKQGVVVMVNGKRSRMEMAAIIQMLQGMDAGSIEQIELITTPPANFDADGDAGIINIVMVKSTADGFNGSANASVGYSERWKSSAGLNFNYARNKFNLYANLSAQQDWVQHNVKIDRTVFFKSTETQTLSDSDRPAFVASYRGNLGLDYALTRKTTIGLLFTAYTRHWDLDAKTIGSIKDNMGDGFHSALNSQELNDSRNWMTNFHLEHQWSDKTNISLDVDYLKNKDDNPTEYLDQQTTLEGQALETQEFRSHKINPITFWVGKTDLQHQWSPLLNMELGVKATISDFYNENSVNRLQHGEWTIDPLLTSQHEMEEKIGAAYTSLSYNFNKKTEMKAGLRYEYIDSDLRKSNGESVVRQQYGRWFPSIFFGYQWTEELRLQFAYNERISRPAFNDIAPALFFWNPTTLLSGNPAIQPTFTKQIKADLRFKSINFTVQYSHDKQPISWGQPEVDLETNLMINLVQNMKDRKSLMFSLASPINWTTWFSSRLSGTAFWNQQRPIFDGQVYKNSFWWLNGSMNHEFKLGQKFTTELSGSYYSDSRPGVGRFVSRWQLNLGVSKAFAKNDGRLSITWTDIFKTANFWQLRYEDASLGFISDWKYEIEGSILRLTYSRSFGNQKVKKVKERQGGSAAERQRIN